MASPLKIQYKRIHIEISKKNYPDTTSQTDRKRFISLTAILNAWEIVSRITNIEISFEKTGIYPFNPSIPLNSPFVFNHEQFVENTQNSLQIDNTAITTDPIYYQLIHATGYTPALPSTYGYNAMFYHYNQKFGKYLGTRPKISISYLFNNVLTVAEV
ncbi:hypothetical protein TRFO_42973 [Tritrichomonas foetus]|uniref:Uncharacterized protein n=1 Tax=Tritrichomonas foetus TaxID=1144522 RepID=A0A1J4KXY7_9EUKA|nr:hypothetical protein TRFO_42973 [Tritrichomonas foetus]|eukprot:OHT14564.1 hypothetical protein TRFO_42973 [Tritrichomonas foetus]